MENIMRRVIISPRFYSSVLSFGGSMVGDSKIWVKLGNNIVASLMYEETILGYWYNVTIVDNNSNPVANKQIKCVTNGQSYTTNSSGQIPETIESQESSLKFTWSSTTTNAAINGLLYAKTRTNNYTGTVNGSPNITVNTATSTTVSYQYTNYYVNMTPSLGATIKIGSYDYIIAHIDNSNVYVALKSYSAVAGMLYYTNYERIPILYSESNLKTECEQWWNSCVSMQWRNVMGRISFSETNAEGGTTNYSVNCTAPPYSLIRNWDYFNTAQANRVYSNKDYWLAGNTIGGNYVGRVRADGDINGSTTGASDRH